MERVHIFFAILELIFAIRDDFGVRPQKQELIQPANRQESFTGLGEKAELCLI